MRVRTTTALATAVLVGVSGLTGFTTTSASGDSGAPGTAPYDSCPLLVAAQGGGGPGQSDTKYPENSMAAFKRSINYGAWALETDVRYTKDNELVLMKDPTLDRTTNGKGPVADYTFQQLKQFKLKNGEPIPSLADFANLLQKTNMKGFLQYVDQKKDSAVYYKKLLAEVEDTDTEMFVLGSSGLMDYANDNEPAIPVIWTPDPADGNPVDGKEIEETTSSGPPTKTLVQPWPQQADVPEGADVGMTALKTTEPWVTDMRGIDSNVYAWFENKNGVTGDNPQTWAALAKWKVRWIASTNVSRYLTWNNSGGNGSCQPQPKREQYLKCFQLQGDESPFAQDSRVLILKRGCRTTALHHVKVKVKAKKGVAKLISNKGKRVIQTGEKRGKVTIILSAKGKLGYDDYKTKHVRFVR